jgi:hypothetical protein
LAAGASTRLEEGVRVERLSQRAAGQSPKDFLLTHAWKLGFGLLAVALLTARGASQPMHHLPGRALAAAAGGPTVIQCGALPSGTTTWSIAGSPYILPSNDPVLGAGDSAHPNCLRTDSTGTTIADDIYVPADGTLVIDASQGPVQIFSHGAGLVVTGGQIQSIGSVVTDSMGNITQQNTVTFDAEPDAASWDGIKITTGTTGNGTFTKGQGLFAYTSIQHSLTGLQIDSGSTALTGSDGNHYGLVFANGGIGPSYFDGIDATNTPIELTGKADGRFGTVNNIGSQGMKVTFDSSLPNYPSASTFNRPMHVDKVVFGSSVPFGDTVCIPLQPCAAGTIGNDAIQGNLGGLGGVAVSNNNIFRAGSYGLELNGADYPTISGNTFVCNGGGSARPIVSCTGSGLRYSAIYLNNAATGSHEDLVNNITGNQGQENGLDALVLNGTVSTRSGPAISVDWKTPYNDPSAPPTAPHDLGYMVANGDLQLVGTLNVHAADVVKASGGAIVIKNGLLKADFAVDAKKLPSTVAKTFTSMRDNGIGIQACPSVFVQSCPNPIPSNEWTGMVLSGSGASIDNANILFPTRGVDISGVPGLVTVGGKSYGAAITNSRIGPSFSDSILSVGSSIYVADNHFCRIDNNTLLADNKTPNNSYGLCIGPGPGDHGINVAAAGLTVWRNVFQGSTNEAILGTTLGGRAVDVESNSIDGAGAYGVQLVDADNPTVAANTVTRSGLGNLTYPAIYLNGISNGNFVKFVAPVPTSNPACTCISWNMGYGNGLDAIAFHGTTGTLDWMSPVNIAAPSNAPPPAPARFGYLLDNSLNVTGDLNLNTEAHNLVEIAQGSITVSGTLTATNAVVTSLKQDLAKLPVGFPAGAQVPTCGSVFDPRVSGNCQKSAAGDWSGFALNGQNTNTLTTSDVRYAGTGIRIDKPAPATLTLNQSNVSEVAADGIHSESPLSITGGQIGNAVPSNGNGIWFDQSLTIAGPTKISNTGQEGILGSNVGAVVINVQAVTVDGAGTYGIRLMPSASTIDGTQLTLKGNTVTDSGTAGSGAPYPAIYINGVTNGDFTNAMSGNLGYRNGLDAIAFHGSLATDLLWRTTFRNQLSSDRLGYLLDGGLDLAGHQLTVNAGDVVKVGNQGSIALDGGSLRGDDSSTSESKIFTSLGDTSAGVSACPPALMAGCGAPRTGDWGGIVVSGTSGTGSARGDLINAVIRYATTGLSITSQAQASFDSSLYGFTVSKSIIGPTKLDAITASATPVSVTDSTITLAQHGIAFDFPPAAGAPGAPVRLSGNRITNTSAEAILGTRLGGHPVSITDNHIQGALTYGARLVGADQLMLRNNNVSCSGLDPYLPCPPAAPLTPTPNTYPAIYLNQFRGDFLSGVRGNVGSNNGLDAIAFDGVVTRDLRWVSPQNSSATQALGYILDGGLTLQNSNLFVGAGQVVKVLSGAIMVNQGTIVTAGTISNNAVFTSFRDPTIGLNVCPSVFLPVCTSPSAGDWGGLSIKGLSQANPQATSVINKASIRYADTGLAIDAGPFGPGDPAAATNFRLQVSGSTITDTTKDAINSLDTPVSVDGSVIGLSSATTTNIGGYGVYASFLSPANCAPSPPACERLHVSNTTIWWTGKDGIAATGLAGQPAVAIGNVLHHAGTYGIRLVGADHLKLSTNDVESSGNTSPGYPAIYLNQVSGDFNQDITGNTGSGGPLNVLALHGVATNGLTWLAGATNLPYLIDGDLTINGPLQVNSQTLKSLSGKITVNGALTSNNAIFTSMKDNSKSPPQACPSVFVQACVASSADWGGLVVNGGPSTLSQAVIRYAATGLMGDGGVSIDSASIQQNAIGLSLTPGDSVTQSDVLNNSIYDLVAPAGVVADSDWWGGTPPKLSGAVVVTNPLKSQRPSLATGDGGSIMVTGTNTNANGKIGKGSITITLNFSRRMDSSLQPLVGFDANTNLPGAWIPTGLTWVSNPLAIDSTNASTGNKSLQVAAAIGAVRDPSTNLMKPYPAAPTTDFTTDMTVPTAPSAVSITTGATTHLLSGTVYPSGWHATFDFKWTDLSNVVHSLSATPSSSASTSPVSVSASLSDPLITSGHSYPVVLVAHYGNGDASSASATMLTPTASIDHFDINIAGAATAGTPVTATITAKDAGGLIVHDYSGSLTLLSNDSNAAYLAAGVAPPAKTLATTLTFPNNGSGSIAVTLFFAQVGADTFNVKDGALKTAPADSSITVSASTLDHFTMIGLAGGPAGTAQSVVVTALDSGSATITNYGGMVHFASTDPIAGLPADYTFVAGDNGTHTFTITLKTAQTSSVTISDVGLPSVTKTQAGLVITAASPAHLVLSGVPSSIPFPAGATAGNSSAFTLTATDDFGNASAYNGTVHFSSTDPQAVKPADVSFGGASSAVSSVTFKTAGPQTITATDTVTSTINATSSSVSVGPASTTQFVVTGLPSTVMAGTPTAFTLTAEDAYSNPTPTYAGTVQFFSTDAQAAKPGDITFPGSSSTVPATVTLKTVGAQTITAKEKTNPAHFGTSPSVAITPAATSQLVVSGLPANATAGKSVAFVLTAEDPYTNPTPLYRGTVRITSSDSIAGRPADLTFTGATATAAITFKTAGLQTVTGQDTGPSSTIAGPASAAVTVAPATVSTLAFSTAALATTAGVVSGTITVTQEDPYGNAVLAPLNVPLTLTTSNPATGTFYETNGTTPLSNPTIGSGTSGRSFTYKDTHAGRVTLTATAAGLATASQSETIAPAGAASFALAYSGTVTHGNAFALTVTARDGYGNVATGYTGTIKFKSSDGAAILPTNYTFTTGPGNDNGIAVFAFTLMAAGTPSVTVTDTSTATITGSVTVAVS